MLVPVGGFVILHTLPCSFRSHARSTLLTTQGKPPFIGSVKLFWLVLSLPTPHPPRASSNTSSKSYSHTKLAITYTASSSAIFFPRHVLGPALKTGNSYAVLDIRVSFSSPLSMLPSSQRSGRKIAASSPQISVERPIAHGIHKTTAPCGRNVPSGKVVGALHSLSSRGTGGYRRIVSLKTAVV